MLNQAQVPSSCVPCVSHNTQHNTHACTPKSGLPVTSPEFTTLHQLMLFQLGPVLAWTTQVCEGEILRFLRSVSHTLSRPTPAAFFIPPGPDREPVVSSTSLVLQLTSAPLKVLLLLVSGRLHKTPLPSVSYSPSPPLEPATYCLFCGLKYLLSRVQPEARESSPPTLSTILFGVYRVTVF